MPLPAKIAAGCILAFGMVTAAGAQQQPIEPWSSGSTISSQDEGLQQSGRTAETGVGAVGQRQEQVDSPTDARPIGRIDNRISNRVQNRLRNRVDRNYDPRANATSPFERAAERSQDTGLTRSQ